MEKIKVRRRIQGTLTLAQQRRVAKARKLIAAELPELVRRNQMRHDARKEKTLSGALRRAVHAFRLSPMKIAERGNIPWADFSRFLTGEKTLPSDAVDRLVKVLKLRLPTSKARGTSKAS
jgi:hypothetical protein